MDKSELCAIGVLTGLLGALVGGPLATAEIIRNKDFNDYYEANPGLIIEHKKETSHLGENSYQVKGFAPGDHIIIIDISDRRERFRPFQIPYHEGYKFEGLTGADTDVVALYVNNEEVYAFPTGIGTNNEMIYDTFGVSVNKEEKDENNYEQDVYNPGEHIIAVPIKNPEILNNQIECPEGYHVEDISYFGKKPHNAGAFVIFINDIEVKCDKDENGQCISFGTPIEKIKVKTL